MRGTSLKITGLGVLAALAAAPAAQANLASAPSLAGVLNYVPVLESANVLNDRDVEFCFDRPVELALPGVDADDFELDGYDVSTANIEAAAVTEDDGKNECVIATFPLNGSISNRTVATVEANSVRSLGPGNQGNLLDGVALGGSIEEVGAGYTSAPDVTGVSVDYNKNRLTVEFDRPVGAINPALVSYYEAGGDEVVAVGLNNQGYPSVVNSANPNQVFFAFNQTPTENVIEAIRLGLEPGAVSALGEPAEQNVRQSFAIRNLGDTDRPELTGAARGPGNSVDFFFDQGVDINVVACFDVIRDEETIIDATSAVVLEGSNNRTVRARYNNVGGDFLAGDEIALATVGECAVTAANGGQPNTIGTAKINNGKKAAGYTSAPDATSVSFDALEGTAMVTFDQGDIDVDDIGDFNVIDYDGNNAWFGPNTIVETGSNYVIFYVGAETAQKAAGITIEGNSVDTDQDATDNNVNQALARTNVKNPPGPLHPPAPGPGPAPAPAPSGGTAGQVAAAPTARVSPSRSGKSAKARVLYAKYRKGTLTAKISSKAKKVKIRISLRNKKGKTIKTVTRTVRTNRQVKLKNLTRSKKVKSVKIRVL